MLALLALMGLASCGQEASEKVVLDNIFSRRSVRSYSDKDVTSDQVETLLKAAMAAPSGMNLQPWRFVVVRDQSVKKSLTKSANGFAAAAPVIIVVCAEMIPMESNKYNQNWMADCAAASENLLLAAQAMGLGACWTAVAPYMDRIRDVQRALKLPEDIRPYSMIPVGYPNGDEQPKDKWNPQYIRYERWPLEDEKGRGGRFNAGSGTPHVPTLPPTVSQSE